MKKFYILFVVALFIMNGAMAQWVPQNSGTTNGLSSVYFTDINTGYIVGDSGTILKTIDGGTNWGTQYSGTQTWLSSVYFTNVDTGYVVGNNGIILKTINGGTNWFLNSIDSSSSFNSVHFPSENIGYTVGSEYDSSFWNIGLVLKTVDGGLNWERHEFIENSPLILNSVFFISIDTGFATAIKYGWTGGGSGIIFKTTNGGNDWTTCYSFQYGEYSSFNGLYFTDKNTGFALGGSEGAGHIFRTMDGGSSWINIDTYGMFSLSSVYFPTHDTGYIVGNENTYSGWQGAVLRSTDAGNTWTEPEVLSSNCLYSVYFTDSETGYVAGCEGNILKTTNGSVGINDQHQPSITLSIYPNPSFDKIIIESPTQDQLSIMNLNGQQLITRQLTAPKTQLDISTLPSGVYFVRVMGEKTVQVGKFIKQ